MQARAFKNATGEPIVLRDRRDGILRLTLNNATRRNSLSEAMMAALQTELDAATDDRETRVIVIGHEGPAFSAGHDLRELDAGRAAPDEGRAYFTDIMNRCSKLMQTVVNHPRPVIADVRGIATAAGCQLVASCDIVIASEESRFATPGVNIGLFCSTPMVALSRKVGQNHAMEMLLTGEFIGSRRAREIGLVTRVVEVERQNEAVAALAARIASKSLMTLKTGKQAFYQQADMPLAQAYAHTVEVMIGNMLRHDAKEGVEAFLQKRQPSWRDE
ncbi:MAG: enoyl-CoA hydratase [Nitratireductor sp.]